MAHKAEAIPIRATKLSPSNKLLKFNMVTLKAIRAKATTINRVVKIFMG
jgi:hypothetical protein